MKDRAIASKPVAAALAASMLCGAAVAAGQQSPATPKLTVPLFGVVRDLSGSPVEGATVRALHEDLAGCDRLMTSRLGVGRRYGASTKTNAKGRFVLKVAATGSFGIVASRGNTERSQVFAPAAPAGQHELTLRPTITVRGRFVDVDDDSGKERAPSVRTVRSFGPVFSAIPSRPTGMWTLSMIDEVTTNASGQFEILALEGVPCRIADPWRTCERTLAADAASHNEPVQLSRDVVRTHGVVVDDETGAPIPHAQLLTGGTSAQVAPDGSFDLYAPNSGRAFFTATGYRTIICSHKQAGETIRMVATDEAHVTITAADGQPASGGEVVACEIAVHELGSAVLMRRLTADANGQLRISRPDKHGITLFANCSGRLMRIAEVLGGSGDVRIACSLAGHRVAGTVLGIDGIPAAHVPIYASPTETALGSRWPLAAEPVAYTDHAGKFVTPPLANLEHALASRSQRSAVAFTQPFLPAKTRSGAALPQRIELQEAPTIAGKVFDAAGEPLVGATVISRPIGKRDRRIDQFGLWGSRAVSDREGRFELPFTVAEATHVVSARYVDSAGVFHMTQAETAQEARRNLKLRLR